MPKNNIYFLFYKLNKLKCHYLFVLLIGKCMAALLNGLSDRNTTVRKSYSTCLANVCKVAKDTSTEKLVAKLHNWYMEKDGMYYNTYLPL